MPFLNIKGNYLGHGVMRKYSLPEGTENFSTPAGKSSAISSFLTEGITMQGVPGYEKQ